MTFIQETPTTYRLEGSINDNDLIAFATRLLTRRLRHEGLVENPSDARRLVRLKLARHQHEVFSALLFDARHRLLAYEPLFRGTLDGAAVYPREVVKVALAANAAAVIFAHNHPSGVAEPSQADRQITRRLQKALALIDIRVLDHFVVGDESTVSFAERGWL